MEKKGNGIFIVVITLIVLVGGGVTYLLYRKAKAKAEVKEIGDDESSEIPKSETPSEVIPKVVNPNPSITKNPFKSADELKRFQKWILKYHETDGKFGKGSATPVVVADGVWGKNSAKAWDKYGKRYTDFIKAPKSKFSSYGQFVENKDNFSK